MPTNQIMPFATGAQARVLTPDAYAALAARVNGFVQGPADEVQLNTVWRQSSFVSAMVAQFTADRANVDVLDNGDITTFENNFAAAVAAVAAGQVPSIPTSSYWHTGIDTSGSAQSLIADVAPSITSYAVGNVFELRTAHAAAGPTTANLDAVGVRNVVRADGSPIQAGDWSSGEMIFLADDGNNLRLYGVKSSLEPARKLVSFNTAGAGTWRVPSVANGDPYDVNWVLATCIGAGAGGSGTANGAAFTGGGGGAGGTAIGWIKVTPGELISYVIGAGSPGVGYQQLSANGGTTTIGGSMSATGGFGTTNNGIAGGPGGTGAGGQVNLIGGAGGDGIGTGGNLFTPTAIGGGSSLGGGGRAAYAQDTPTNGRAPGSGGGGLYGNTAANAGNGGKGADGYISFQY